MNETKDWTNKELSLRPGIVQLAQAVIEQWKLDNCPKSDEQAIKYWSKIVEDYDTKKTEPKQYKVSTREETENDG